MKTIAHLLAMWHLAWFYWLLRFSDKDMADQLKQALDDGFSKYPPKEGRKIWAIRKNRLMNHENE